MSAIAEGFDRLMRSIYGDERVDEVQARLDAEALARSQTTMRPVQLHFDVDYGASNRTGWSVIVDGVVVVQFAPLAQALAALPDAVRVEICNQLHVAPYDAPEVP